MPLSGARMVVVLQLHLGVVDIGLIERDRGIERRGVGDDLIDLFLGRDAALEQILIAHRLRFGVRRHRDVAIERRLRLLQRRFEGPLSISTMTPALPSLRRLR